jgi:NADPH-dependent ferric siderophore reductase
MPEMPAFLANVMEPRFARPAQVTDVVELAPELRRVRLEGPALRGVSFRPGQEVEFRVSERHFRHYTPAVFDAEAGALEIVFYLHGGGPGSRWAEGLRHDQRVGVLGPGGGLSLRAARRHVLLGDETALGLFACLAAAAPRRCTGAVEVRPGGRSWPFMAGLEFPGVERTGGRGDALLGWLDGSGLTPDDYTCFYLAGHAGTLVRVRERLLRAGWSRRSVRTKAYWADGKRGL